VTHIDEITLIEVRPQIVLGMRKRGKYEQIKMMFPEIFEYAFATGIDIAGPPLFVMHELTAEEVINADDEGTADIEVAVPILKPARGSGDITCYEIPGGTMARILHKGPYEDAGSTYEKLFAWIRARGKRITGPIREVFLNDPHAVPPDRILTGIYAPVE
jgi:AraC family transcriptional regulator